ncbi:RimK family alpha-L-glutamate ligase [Streptomyces sp. AC602_WCS936]|uniref:ATP-grasp domain-containing protein n=1 Tax=Streptomyces sp. AC602_WCS936 TaxID=2823685 RepID=UPI0027E46F87|nr:RimK family alpha-L-glutamate ligase [Streptomyces sp. AC602_WCS936]
MADRVGWEERRLIRSAPDAGLRIDWINDESLCLGQAGASPLAEYDAVLVRSRSYTRGGLIATLAEADGTRTLNSAAAIHACENKLVLRAVLREAGVPVPDFRLAVSRKDFDRALSQLGTPVVLKPVYGGMGKRVTLVRDRDLAHSVYDYVEDLGHAFEQACLVEPYLGGGSIRCLVIGREIVAAAEFESAGGDWRSNAALGNRSRSLAHDPEVHKIVDGVVDRLGAGLYGIDLFRTPSGYLVNEVNHAPAWRGVASTTDADITSAVLRHVQEALI